MENLDQQSYCEWDQKEEKIRNPQDAFSKTYKASTNQIYIEISNKVSALLQHFVIKIRFFKS
jgi:hypothetical protein